MKRWGCVSAIVGSLLLLACGGFVVPVEALFYLFAGWVLFLVQVAPHITVSWPGVGTAAAALAVLIAGLQTFGGWWMSARSGATSEVAPRWRWRWTLMMTVAIVLSFTAGIGVVGAAHQLAWLATSRESMVDYNWEAPGRTQTRNNLKLMGLALHNYETDEKRFPAGGVFDEFGRPMFSWQTVLLPYIDQAALYNSIQLGVPWDDPANATALGIVVPMYLVSSRKLPETRDAAGRALSHYAGNGRVLNAGAGLPLTAFKDGTSNTLMAGEATANSRPWGYPANWRDAQLGINQSPDGFGSPWKNGATFLMTDGSARFISEEIDPQLLEALSTPDGGEPVGEF